MFVLKCWLISTSIYVLIDLVIFFYKYNYLKNTNYFKDKIEQIKFKYNKISKIPSVFVISFGIWLGLLATDRVFCERIYERKALYTSLIEPLEDTDYLATIQIKKFEYGEENVVSVGVKTDMGSVERDYLLKDCFF